MSKKYYPNAKETMLCWKPGTDDVKLVSWPDRENKSKGYYAGLACYSKFQEMDFEDRKKMVFIEAMRLIVRDRKHSWSWKSTGMDAETICQELKGARAMTTIERLVVMVGSGVVW